MTPFALGLLTVGTTASLLATAVTAQARPPLTVAQDSSGVLSAVRSVDFRQLCRCRVVVLDTVVRRGSQIRVFALLHEPRALGLRPSDLALLQLAGHRVTGATLASMGRNGPDTAFTAIQLVSAGPSRRQVAVVATPPNGLTTTYLVELVAAGKQWRVAGVRTVLEP